MLLSALVGLCALLVAPSVATAVSPACGGGAPPPDCFTAWGGTGAAYGQFQDPLGNAVDQKGFVYVADSGNSRIEKFTNTGGAATPATIGPAIPGGTNLSVPTGVAVDNPSNQALDPNIYVADQSGHVQKLSPTGGFLLDFGAFNTPVGVDVDAAGHVLVTDAGTSGPGTDILAKFAPNGTLLNVYGKPGGGPGSGPGEFNQPLDIATDPPGDLYVADSSNNRLQRLDPAGSFISQTTGLSGPAGVDHALELTGPTTIVDRIWVTERSSDQFVKLDDTGSVVQTEGGTGSAVGQFMAPYGLSADCDGNVFVSDSGNDRMQRLGDANTPPCTPPTNTRSPELAGQPQVGSGLALDPGDWTGSPNPRLSYRWQRCTSTDPASCGDIAGERGLTYVASDADRGFRLRAVVIGANVDGIVTEPTDMTPPIPTESITPLPPVPPNPPPTPTPTPKPGKPSVKRTGLAKFEVTCPTTGAINCKVRADVVGQVAKRGFVELAKARGGVKFSTSKKFKLALTKRGRRLVRHGYNERAVLRVSVDGKRRLTDRVRVNRHTAHRFGG